VALPRNLCQLIKLGELSLEWYSYTKSNNTKTQTDLAEIKSFRNFCQSYGDPCINTVSFVDFLEYKTN
jgi:hypothetical protein